MNTYLVGTETWDCGGCSLTPTMRREILLQVAELYDCWDANGFSYVWSEAANGLVAGEPNDVATIGEFLSELTGEQHPFCRGFNLDWSAKFHDLLMDYLIDKWADDIFKEDEIDDEPTWQAEARVTEWLHELLIEDVLEWRSAMLKAESQATDWRTCGF